jgi:hypothetical protein
MSPNRHHDRWWYVIPCSAAKRRLIRTKQVSSPSLCLPILTIQAALVDMPLSPSSSSIEKLGDFCLDSLEQPKHGELCPDVILKERDDNDSEINMAAPSGLTPVSFSAMFRSVVAGFAYFDASSDSLSSRFATRFELFLDFIGLVAAAGAGAAQVCSPLPI